MQVARLFLKEPLWIGARERRVCAMVPDPHSVIVRFFARADLSLPQGDAWIC